MTLPPELAEVQARVRRVAASYGLDFFQTVFEMVDWDEMNTIASYEGFPIRYPHWRWGMQYDQISKSYQWGLSKIYELVINNDPCYAYLLRGNSMVDQKLVMAHVYAHCDFFKNNLWFAPTNRRMVDELASHAAQVNNHISREGYDVVEEFLDACLSLENLVDIYAPYAPKKTVADDEGSEKPAAKVVRFDAKPYMDSFINPPEFIEEQRKEIEEQRLKPPSFPERPERDVLLFLMEHAPLRSWQRDLLAMVREEAYYFAPQRLTKVMNEGWASYWHSRMMTEKLLEPHEIIDFAERHAGAMIMQPGQVNPYKLGIELYRDIEDRWNRGRFGKEFEDCDDLDTKRAWDTGLGQGREKIFEVRRIYNDVTFVDEFLTEDFCERQKMFTYDFNPKTGRKEISGREFGPIKERLISSLANGGQPVIEVVDGNFKNRGELILRHRHHGSDLKVDWAQETLKHLHRLWTRPVHIHTMLEGEAKRISFDGSNVEVEDA
ncbi:MAG: SpoVR family protein [Planctomycetota bacterium]|jgi:stage V sporulation protein R